MTLFICPECGKEISDKSIACSNCGYPMKYQTPYYPDIEIHSNIDGDWYYDTKNNRDISVREYLAAEDRYDEECERKYTLQPGQIPEDILEFVRRR